MFILTFRYRENDEPVSMWTIEAMEKAGNPTTAYVERDHEYVRVDDLVSYYILFQF